MAESADIIIVGAGIVGAACAASCSAAGFHVLVLDRSCIAGGTTAAGMGHIVVMDDSEAQFALTSYSRNLWLERRPSLPEDVEYELCGTLWVAMDDQEMAEVHRKAEFYSKRGVSIEVLDNTQIRRVEPQLRPGAVGGLRVPDDGVIYPPCAAQHLLEVAKQHGAEVRENTAVRHLMPEGGVVLASGEEITAGRVVNACGPWSPELTAGLAVRRRKGHLLITERYPGFVKHQIIELGYLKSAHSYNKDSVAFNIQPRRTGQMLVGSSRQYDAEDTGVEHHILDRMLERACYYLPKLGELVATRAWTGHRAATPDKLPIIGPVPGNEKVWIATGHEGLGITTSLGTGQILADLLQGKVPAIDYRPYCPGRFAQAQTTP